MDLNNNISDCDVDALVAVAAAGDQAARDRLLDVHRARIRRMVDIHLDRRLMPRIDPSDVVQDALADAILQLADYLNAPNVPFYPWLRQVAWQRLMQVHRHHIHVKKRSVKLEAANDGRQLPDQSAIQLAEQLAASQSSPSREMIRKETVEDVRLAMDLLPAQDRRLLVLRHLEQLSVEETAAVMNMTPSNVKVRHFRALRKLERQMSQDK